jgi:hypothetical protein
MQNSQNYMKSNGIMSRISFNDGQAHTVKLLKDKEDTIPDGHGNTIKGMKYLVEENGEEKSFFTGSIGLVSKLAMCEEGDVVTIKMGKANNKSFYTVTKAGGEEIKNPEVEDDDGIPVAEPKPEW